MKANNAPAAAQATAVHPGISATHATVSQPESGTVGLQIRKATGASTARHLLSPSTTRKALGSVAVGSMLPPITNRLANATPLPRRLRWVAVRLRNKHTGAPMTRHRVPWALLWHGDPAEQS